jgi:putative transposase
MSKDSKELIIEHISPSMLNDYIRMLEKVAKKINRLHFVQQMYDGRTVREACAILKMSERTGYNWLKKWNDGGLDGLNHKKGAGRPPFLSDDQFKEVDDYIKNNDSLETKDVHEFIEKNFGVDYTLKQIREIIKKLDYGWIKPYPVYSKSPDNAKEILKEDVKEIDSEKDIFGYYDESSLQNLPNISKVLKKKEKNTKLR